MNISIKMIVYADLSYFSYGDGCFSVSLPVKLNKNTLYNQIRTIFKIYDFFFL